MSWFAKRPALLALTPFISGIIFARFYDAPMAWLLGGLGVALFLSLLLHLLARPVLFTIVILFALALLGALRLEMQTRLFPRNHIKDFTDLPYTVAVEGVVCKPVDTREEGQTTVIAVDSVWVLSQVYPAEGRCLLRLFEATPGLSYGDRIVVRGQLRAPQGERNPGDFNYRNYLAAQDIHAIVSVASANHLLILNKGQGAPLLQRLVYPARRFVLSFVDSTMIGKQAALLKALLTGARGDIDDELRNSFADVGVIHVLAVSGLHVGFIMAGLLGFLGFLRIPNPWRTLLTAVGLLFYAWLTGLSPSVTRATVMAIVVLGGMLLQRRSDVLNSLAVAAFILLVVQPLDLFQPGFQLSFAAVAGIVLLYNRFAQIFHPLFMSLAEKGLTLLHGLLMLFFVSLAAQLATLPLTVYYFGRLPVISLLANVLVVPLVGLIVGLALVAVLTAVISFPLGAVFANTVWLLLTVLIAIVETASKIPFAYFAMSRPSFILMAFYLLALFLFLLWRDQRARKLIVFAAFILAAVVVWVDNDADAEALRVTFFDVGQGDAALLQFPNGKTMLIDAGDCTDYVDYGERVIAPFLQRQGVRRIDCLLLTHAHADHIGGAPSILQKFQIGRLVQSGCPYPSGISARIDSLADAHGVRRQLVAAGDTLLLDPKVLILVLHPTQKFLKSVAANPADLNNASVVVKCIYESRSLLFTGDAEAPSEAAMLRFGALLQSDVLKLGHHGSPTAGSREFRQRVAPKIGVVSVARYNRFGLPSDSLLQAFRTDGVDIIQTADNGAVQFVLSSNGIRRIR